MNEFSFGALDRIFSLDYDEITKKARVYVHGVKYDLGWFESFAAAMQAALEFVRQKAQAF